MRQGLWRRLSLVVAAAAALWGLGTSQAFGAAAATDVLFVFDTTGSMSGALSAAQLEAQSAVDTIAGRFPNVRFASAEVRDYGSSPVWEVTQGLTADRGLVKNAIDTYTAFGGGDNPEAYGTALRQADRDPAVGWLPGAKRVVVFVADDVPHDDDLNDGVPISIVNQPSPWDTGSDPGLDGSGVDWQRQLAQAAARGLTLAYVLYDGDPDFLPYWNHWAGITGGSAVGGGDSTSLAQTLATIISSAAVGGVADGDKDGLPDLWETSPVDLTGDGVPDLDLAALGARVDRPDIFVQLDWTPGARLDGVALRKVVQAFDRRGISLHIDRGPGSLINYTTGETWGARSQAGELTLAQIGGVRGATEPDLNKLRAFGRQRLGARAEAFRYALSDTDWWGISGKAFISGQALYVSVCPNTEFSRIYGLCDKSADSQAGTFMHELGHTLGLGHGGSFRSATDIVLDNSQWKPNYLSVMNYSFQLSGIPSRGIDYSDAGEDVISVLDERSLSERDGLLTSSSTLRGLTTLFICKGESRSGRLREEAMQKVTIGTGPINWNCKNGIDPGRIATSITTTEQERAPLIPRSDWGLGFEYRVGTIGASAYGALDESASVILPEPRTSVLEDALEAMTPRPTVAIHRVTVSRRGRATAITARVRIRPVGTRGTAQLFLLDRTGKRPAGASRPVAFRIKKGKAILPITLRDVGRGKRYRLIVSVRTDAWSVLVGPARVRIGR